MYVLDINVHRLRHFLTSPARSSQGGMEAHNVYVERKIGVGKASKEAGKRDEASKGSSNSTSSNSEAVITNVISTGPSEFLMLFPLENQVRSGEERKTRGRARGAKRRR